VAVEQRPGGILPSNVDTVTSPDAPAAKRPRPGVLVPLLVIAVAMVVGAAIALGLTSSRPTPQAAAPRPTSVAPTTVPTNAPSGQSQRKPAAVAAPMPAVNGISCDTLESTIVHMHIHLAIFFDGEEQVVPFGVGIGEPWQVSPSAAGPFVEDGTCFYWIHTHTEDGVVHIEAPIRRTFTLGDFFAIWEQPLSANQVGPAQGPVIVYVDGDRAQINPADIRLNQHTQIQLDVGTDVPPYFFEFPRGD